MAMRWECITTPSILKWMLLVMGCNLVDAIKNKKHTDGECWINALIDHYEETLMTTKKWESKRMTRDKILKLMKLDEEELKKMGHQLKIWNRCLKNLN